ncbi:uncharacterized protein E0L32_003710 [Thyridium curvatum]|uniref:Uncharacterized protein n=1 Tax=Thyridium curvatum TaxID=1093900 RepID=A0A507BB07_9PEZI|nr:uncharacterized protein E0L32_003710 [Thyridium curvatum]TPX16416.1 hypothetical protein E0L32_003710 [Thyridium curvatum]
MARITWFEMTSLTLAAPTVIVLGCATTIIGCWHGMAGAVEDKEQQRVAFKRPEQLHRACGAAPGSASPYPTVRAWFLSVTEEPWVGSGATPRAKYPAMGVQARALARFRLEDTVVQSASRSYITARTPVHIFVPAQVDSIHELTSQPLFPSLSLAAAAAAQSSRSILIAASYLFLWPFPPSLLSWCNSLCFVLAASISPDPRPSFPALLPPPSSQPREELDSLFQPPSCNSASAPCTHRLPSHYPINMATMRGPTGYGIGQPNPFGGPASPQDQENSSPLDAIREQTSKIEDMLDTISEPIKPYLPAIGRFLIVVTFLEDALRIITQWSDQLHYLHDYRHIWSGVTHLFLIVNVIAMSICSGLVIARKYSEYAVGGLIAVVVMQALGYGLIFDLNFFLRNLSVMGGLLMVLSDSWIRKTQAFAGLPQLEEKDRKMYIQLAGRVLLIFLFIGFVFSGEWTLGRILVSLIGLVACVMVVVGFKAKASATLLVVILSVFNILVNNFWTLHEQHPHKDFAKYDFFQILSIVGGLLLLVNSGPGKVSFDEKKKVY